MPSLVFAKSAVQTGACHDARRTHHIEHAGDKAEQQKYNEPPRRYTEYAIDTPAEAGTDQHAGNEFAREPKAPGVARCGRRAILRSVIRWVFGTLACQTFAEPLEPRGESGLIGVRLAAVVARVAHGLDTRGFAAIARRPPPEAGRTILRG